MIKTILGGLLSTALLAGFVVLAIDASIEEDTQRCVSHMQDLGKNTQACY
jgi:hypothetical protein